MGVPRLLVSVGAGVLVLLVATGLGIWWYLFGPNEIASANLVPGNTVFFASIPNAATLLAGYDGSQARTLIESSNSQPLRDTLKGLLGQKNVDLLHTFLPNLSGQSFIAVTHFDYAHPERIGLIAAMKPKAGLGDFGAFLDKLKAAYPDELKAGHIGTGNVAGYDYDWIQGPGASDRICVAHIRGWIVSAWGEDALQDWLERYNRRSTTSCLADNADYRSSLASVGDDPTTLIYVNCHAAASAVQQYLAPTNPALGEMLSKRIDLMAGAAVASRFENGEIVDRFSFLVPRPAQLEAGLGTEPCTFETLKFTGRDTRFYWASCVNWRQYYRHLQATAGTAETSQDAVATSSSYLLNSFRDWARGAGLDIEHNILNALGPEISLQAEWSADAMYPEAGIFVKIDKPDDFRPVINAIIDTTRRAYANTGVIKEINSNGQNFAMLQFVPPGLFSPTITEDGPYLGLFLTGNQAARSFARDASLDLTHNADFTRQIGDRRNGASQILFLNSPALLDRAYRTALPFVSFAQMFNKDIAGWLKGRQLPDDLTWIAPMGTWSAVVTPDDAGVQAYSVSGMGNQGIYVSAALGAGVSTAQALGYLPKATPLPPHSASIGEQPAPASPPPPSLPNLGTPPLVSTQTPTGNATNSPAAETTPATRPAGAPSAPATPDVPASAAAQ